jgi:hypothetical protein
MYVELLARSERCIEQQHDHELTVSALWEKVKALAAKEHFVLPDTMSDFECLLEGDKRFRLNEMKSEDGENVVRETDDDDMFLDMDEVEGLGFDHEQKVTLARLYREDDTDDSDDEAFAPRPFAKNDDHAETPAGPGTKKKQSAAVSAQSAAEVKKPARRKTITKRK